MNTEGLVGIEGCCRDSEGWTGGVGMECFWYWLSGDRSTAPPTPLCSPVSVAGLCGSFT